MLEYISIDEAKARSWEKEVKNEIDQVKGILSEAIKAQLALPGEDDSIMQNIQGFYTKLDNVWGKTCNDFNKAQDLLEQAISGVIAKARELSNEVDEMTSKIGFGSGNGGGGFR